jgi:hypothetical protein
MTVGAHHVALIYLFQQPRVRATFGDKVSDRGLFYGAVAMVKLHHPRVERSAAILTGPPFNLQKNCAQPLPLSALVPAILSDKARSVSLVVETMVSALARLTFALESTTLAVELVCGLLQRAGRTDFHPFAHSLSPSSGSEGQPKSKSLQPLAG